MRVAFCHLKHSLNFNDVVIWKNAMIMHKHSKVIVSLNRFTLLKTFQIENILINFQMVTCTVRSWDARFLGPRKIRVAQNLCNICYLIRSGQDHQNKTCSSRFSLHKSVYLKMFWTQLETVHLQGPCCLMPCSSSRHCK